MNIAAPEDSTTCATKDGPVWFHCLAPAVRYEGKRGADSARANHSENEPSMKELITNVRVVSQELYIIMIQTNIYGLKPDLFEPEVRPSSAQQPLNVRAHTTSIKLSNNKRWLLA